MIKNINWIKAISADVQFKELHRQLRYNRVRKKAISSGIAASEHLRRYVPAIFLDFFRMLFGAIMVFWLLITLLSHLTHFSQIYTLAVLGLIYSYQAQFYKYRLAKDPGFKIPRCGCARQVNESTESVLRSRQSSFLGIPLSVIGILFYLAIIMCLAVGCKDAIFTVSVFAVMLSVYLSCAMLFKIHYLCSNCINIAALNLILVWQSLI